MKLVMCHAVFNEEKSWLIIFDFTARFWPVSQCKLMRLLHAACAYLLIDPKLPDEQVSLISVARV